MTGVLVGLFALSALASAVVSAAETASLKVGASRVRTLTEEGFKGADELASLRSDEGRARVTLFVLNTLLNLVAAGIATVVAGIRWGWVGASVALPVAAVAVVVLCELLPRAVSARKPVAIALGAAPVMLPVHRAVGVLLLPFFTLEGWLGRLGADGAATPEERQVMEITDLGQEEGLVEASEQRMVERVFRLDELTAWEIMTPRVDIFAWKDSLTLEDIIAELDSVPYSRVPVYGENIDDLTGILYVREAYATYTAGRTDMKLRDIARVPLFVPGTLSLTRLLNDFRARRIHMGIVADEFGGTDGLVTLEDVLEELVGEIEDETDIAEEPLIRVSRSEIVVDAGIDVREINYALNLSLPHLDNRSLNGLVLEDLGRVPESGEVLDIRGLRVEILEASDTQVLRARLRKVHPVESGG